MIKRTDTFHIKTKQPINWYSDLKCFPLHWYEMRVRTRWLDKKAFTAAKKGKCNRLCSAPISPLKLLSYTNIKSPRRCRTSNNLKCENCNLNSFLNCLENYSFHLAFALCLFKRHFEIRYRPWRSDELLLFFPKHGEYWRIIMIMVWSIQGTFFKLIIP